MTVNLGLPAASGSALVAPSDGYKSGQQPRWCPGCGDHLVLSTMQAVLPTLGLKRENVVLVSGIGCSSRLPYYMNTYGMHSIHGRAPAIATGLAVSRPDLSVWVITGDGDALSIGGNHLIHALRRNVNFKIILLNNRIYGLTQGQCSPTSDQGTVTASTPMGSIDTPLNPISLALGAEASFVARALDSEHKDLSDILTAAAHHHGTAFVEIYQNCALFNDGIFDAIKDGSQSIHRIIRLRAGMALRFGPNGEHGIVRTDNGDLKVALISDINADAVVIHNPTNPSPAYAFALSRVGDRDFDHVPLGIFRQILRPTYDDLARAQLQHARATAAPNLKNLLLGNETWIVS